MSVKIKRLKIKDFNPELLSEYFNKFYKDDPWNEYLRCPRCASLDSFDHNATYGYKETIEKNLKKCPVCDAKMILFWSPKRSIKYLTKAMRKPGFVGFQAVEDSKVVGWIWGYEVNPRFYGISINTDRAFYIDVICVLENYRKIRPLIVGELYLHLLNKIMQKYSYILTRTHKKAVRIRKLLHIAGFKETGIVSNENPQRDYWIKELI